MNVISLFNGMGTLRQAFADMNIKVDKYYSSEIKPYAIELQQHHFPDVIQVGDINNWKEWDIDWETIDFIGSGSPCQDLSAAGKRAGINGSRSSLFFIFVEILEHVKSLNPNVKFLQENVGSAPKLDVGIMSRALGVYPVRINSSLVTAQLRDRYYWSNIRVKQDGMFGDIVTDIPHPKDRKIMFKDIITDGQVKKNKSQCIGERYVFNKLKDESEENGQKYLKKRIATVGSCPVVYYSCASRGRYVDGKTQQQIEINKTGKANCLTTVSKDSMVFEPNTKLRTLNKIEMCRLQGFPDNYCDILTVYKAGSLLGDGWTLPIIIHILSFMKYE